MNDEHGKLVEALLGMARHVLGQIGATLGHQTAARPETKELAALARKLRDQGHTLVAIAEAMLLVTGAPRDR